MSVQTERLYNLLPTYYRRRDLANGEPLRALLAIFEHELLALEQNLEDLYDDWFIETCADWVIPYIGDLLGVEGLIDPASVLPGQRARVANTLGYRQRKGVAATLERLIADVTNWVAHVVAASDLLSRVQSVEHVEPRHGRTVLVRDVLAMSRLGGPLDRTAHTVDVRAVTGAAPTSTTAPAQAATRGRFNLADTLVFVWRLRAYPVHYLIPAHVGSPIDADYGFSPFDLDLPLLNDPRASATPWTAVEPVGLPIPLTVPLLAADLEQYQREYHNAAIKPPDSEFYGPGRGLSIVKDPGLRDEMVLGPDVVVSRSLDPASPDFVLPRWDEAPLLDKEVVVDVELGRMVFRSPPWSSLAVSYAYGFSGDLGGGPYDRRASLAAEPVGVWQARVGPEPVIPTGHGVAGPDRRPDTLPRLFPTIEAAVEAWNARPDPAATPTGTIEIVDNGSYVLPPAGVRAILPPAGGLVIQAANGRAPAVVGDLTVVGQVTALGSHDARYFSLNGALLDGRVTLVDELSASLTHCTLVPRYGRPSLAWEASEAPCESPLSGDVVIAALDLTVTIRRSIVGMVSLPAGANGLTVLDGVVDAAAPPGAEPADAISGLPLPSPARASYGPPTTVDGVTVLGRVRVIEFGPSRNSILTERAVAQRRQVGSLAYCFVPVGSETPRRLRCQPDLVLANVDDGQAGVDLEARMRPRFTSTRYGDPGYIQLGLSCPVEISRGGQGGSEMGAFNLLHTADRQDNLTTIVADYLAADRTPGVFYVT